MSQIALPLGAGREGPSRIVLGNANAHVFDALALAATWPFRTALLAGPAVNPRTAQPAASSVTADSPRMQPT